MAKQGKHANTENKQIKLIKIPLPFKEGYVTEVTICLRPLSVKERKMLEKVAKK